MAGTSAELSKETVRAQLEGKRFHQIANPNPVLASDVTSTWTIPSAGKDELIFHKDGSYVFAGEVCFVDGHQLQRHGRGAWSLSQVEVKSGDWIATRLVQLGKIDRPENIVGRSLWQVTIAGPNLQQEGEAMDMDDVSECGVWTKFATSTNNDSPQGDDVGIGADSDDDMPTLRSKDTKTKAIDTMTWWVDDVVSWTSERWLTKAETQRREKERKNPKFGSMGRGFLNKRDSTHAAPTDKENRLFGGSDQEISFSSFQGNAEKNTNQNETKSSSASSISSRSDHKKKLPPLVPQRMDVSVPESKPPPPPHTYAGKRVEEWIIIGLSVFMAVVSIATFLLSS